MLAESLNISKTVDLRILKRVWEREYCVYVSFHTPSHLKKEDRVTTCQDIIAKADADKIFLTK